MIQFAALLGTILDGLSDRDHPKGNYIYAVRDGERFIYIGKTVGGVWNRIRQHKKPCDPLWLAVSKAGIKAAHWRVEACHFLTEENISALEAALIQRHNPQINWQHNRRRLPIGNTPLRSEGTGSSPAYQAVIATGWPSFQSIELETLPDRWHAALNRQKDLVSAFADAPDTPHPYLLLTSAEQEIVQFWIAQAVMPAQQLYRRHSSQGLCSLFETLGFRIELDAFREAILVAGYAPVWGTPPARDCAYYLQQAMRAGQSASKWCHQTKLGYIRALEYTWYWPTDALQHYATLLGKLGRSTSIERDRIHHLLAVKYGQRVDRSRLY